MFFLIWTRRREIGRESEREHTWRVEELEVRMNFGFGPKRVMKQHCRQSTMINSMCRIIFF